MHPMRLLWKNVQHSEQYLHVGWVNFALIFLIHHDVVTRATHDAAVDSRGFEKRIFEQRQSVNKVFLSWKEKWLRP